MTTETRDGTDYTVCTVTLHNENLSHLPVFIMSEDKVGLYSMYMSPTLALIVQREADISAFQLEPFYTVNLDCGDFAAASDKLKAKPDAKTIAAACEGKAATVKAVERKEKSEKSPALYDLTTLQRDANRLLGYTAQQTLDYLQSLYEKKLCTYPRTDSRFLTNDMEDLKSGYGKNVRDTILNTAKVQGAASPDQLLRRLDEIEKIYPPKELEAMYLLDNAAYLYLKENTEGYDYTFYDKESLRETGSGMVESVDTIPAAYEQALATENLTPESSEKVSLDILPEIDAVRERDIQEYLRDNNMGGHEKHARICHQRGTREAL